MKNKENSSIILQIIEEIPYRSDTCLQANCFFKFEIGGNEDNYLASFENNCLFAVSLSSPNAIRF
jgi:hypothetical protein